MGAATEGDFVGLETLTILFLVGDNMGTHHPAYFSMS